MKKWYQSKLIWTGLAAVLTAVMSALSSGLGWKEAVLAGLGSLVVVLRAVTDTGISSAPKKPTGIGTACLGIAFAGLLVAGSGCGGALGQFTKDHQDEIAQLEQCALQCGTDIAVDALACPITGGSIKDLVNAEVAKGMAQTAGTCILSCLAGKALVEVCKKDE